MINELSDISQEQPHKKFLDLEKIIASKNPFLLKILPGFLLRYVKRIVHVDELNDFISTNEHLHGLDFVKAILDEFRSVVVVEGYENLPVNDRFVIVANHPLGGLDGIALFSVIGKVRKDVIFPVNDLLLNIPNLRELFIPINKHGKNTENIQLFEDTFASDVALLYFPAGLCSRKQSGRIVDVEWKKTFVAKSRKHKRYVVPVHIDGRNSNFFYNLSVWRKRLGIKANIEMFYLVDEMLKQRDKTLTFRIGKPISWEVFDKRHSDRDWAALMKEKVYALGRGVPGPIEFNGGEEDFQTLSQHRTIYGEHTSTREDHAKDH
ncbi:MAG: 1-acyl-sn-glycerol-3-phosphate acyltransferase [Bacteroidales bacterium]|nr:1-acyl-sn-glycerol-3-phosphate acyltransferase [Bacteroidales bacterium]